MKTKHFYSHLVETTDITIELAEMDLTPDERVHLLSLVDTNIHSTVVHTVLSSLDKEEKKVFLKNLVENDHDKVWIHLKTKSQDIEKELKKTIDNLKKEFLEDIREIKIKKKD